MEAERDTRPQYPIGTVARRTGLSTHVLRAWERRYAVVDPQRSAGGTRLYSNADIVRLRLLRRLTEAGHSIGSVAPLGVEELLALDRGAEEISPRGSASAGGDDVANRFVAGCLEAMEAMDATRVHGLLMRAVMAMSAVEFAEQVVVPLLRQVGDLWSEGDVFPAHEHMLSVCVQRVLHWMMTALPPQADAPVLVGTTPSGERHELGAMMAGVMAADSGWRVLYLGPDLPAPDIAHAVRASSADAVALSVVCGSDLVALAAEIQSLHELLPGQVRLLVGGASAAGVRALPAGAGVDAVWFDDLRGLRAALSALGPGSGAR